MPSFDVVSKLDLHELTNSIDQANRELANRFDFKGSDAVFERSEETVVTLKQGIEQALAKDIVKRIKDAKLKVDVQIQGDKLRINGKKKDDLQTAIALLRGAEIKMPLQYENFRD